MRARRSSTRSAWSRRRSCAACTTRSCARTRPRRRAGLRRAPARARRRGGSAAHRPRRRAAHRFAGCWQRAAAGTGSLVTLIGAYGMGKTRLAAEIAGEAHREGASVLYAAGTGAAGGRARGDRAHARDAAAGAARDRRRRPRARRRPHRAARPRTSLGPAGAGAGHRPGGGGARAARAARVDLARAARRRRRARDRRLLRARRSRCRVPVETLLATSRGVPRRVHEAASEWARREATRRVDAAADRAEAGRTEARAMVDELAGSVVELQSTRERAGRRRDDAADDRVVCPYKGLAPFDADDADYFFGRERLVAELVARLVGAPLLAVVGPSGSGKSSVVRAGLLPALAGGVLPGSHNWTQALIRPGQHPAARAPARDAPARPRAPRRARGRPVRGAVHRLRGRGRADGVHRRARPRRPKRHRRRARRPRRFLRPLRRLPRAVRLLGANNVLVGPMSRDELRRAIELPAERVGLSVEPELVEALLGDVEGRPGALPLLSTALLELWRERDRRQLRLTAYARSGGVQGAVARLAEDAYVAARSRAPGGRAHGSCCGSPTRTRRCARAPPDRARGARGRRPPRSPHGSPTGGCSRSATAPSRSRTRRCCANGRGCALARGGRQGRRLHRSSATPRAPGTQTGATPASSTAARGWPPRSTGRPTTTPSSTRSSAHSSTTAARASGRAQRRLRIVLAGVASLLVLAVGAGAVALDERGKARDEATAATAQRLGAEALVGRGTSTARCCWLVRAWRSTTRCRRAATCSPRCSSAPRR